MRAQKINANYKPINFGSLWSKSGGRLEYFYRKSTTCEKLTTLAFNDSTLNSYKALEILKKKGIKDILLFKEEVAAIKNAPTLDGKWAKVEEYITNATELTKQYLRSYFGYKTVKKKLI